jgi:hypothetical protein
MATDTTPAPASNINAAIPTNSELLPVAGRLPPTAAATESGAVPLAVAVAVVVALGGVEALALAESLASVLLAGAVEVSEAVAEALGHTSILPALMSISRCSLASPLSAASSGPGAPHAVASELAVGGEVAAEDAAPKDTSGRSLAWQPSGVCLG